MSTDGKVVQLRPHSAEQIANARMLADGVIAFDELVTTRQAAGKSYVPLRDLRRLVAMARIVKGDRP